MRGLLERPRVAVAVCAALVVIVAVAMLAGGALGGDGDCPGAGSAGPLTTNVTHQ